MNSSLSSCLNHPAVKLYIIDAITNATANQTTVAYPVPGEGDSPYMVAMFAFLITIIFCQLTGYVVGFVHEKYKNQIKHVKAKLGVATEPV